MALSLLFAAVLLLPAPEGPTPGTLVVGTLAEPVSLEPHRAIDLVGAEIVGNVCDPLVRLRPGTLQPYGVLATAWATSDQRVWTFTLREGVRFHDGAPFDADAVILNLEHLRHERAFPGRATRIGPHVVEIVLDRANSALLPTLSQPFFSMQSPRRLEGPGSELPVCTGPFRLSRARRGRVELEAFTDHWGGPPRLQRLEFRHLPDEDALVRALIEGEVDVSSAIDQGRVDELRSAPDVMLDSQSGFNLCYLVLNNERTPFYDPHVRVALARALDRGRMIAEVLKGHGTPGHTPLPPSLFGYNTRSRELTLDRENTRRQLARTPWPEGFETTLTVSSAPRAYLPEPRRLAELVKDDLAQVGVRVEIVEVPTWPEHTGLVTRGDFDMALIGWQADTPDPNDFLTALLDSTAIDATNRSRYRSDQMDRLLKLARRESAPRTRLGLYRQAQELFQADMPFVPLYHASVFTAHCRRVEGVNIGATGLLRYDEAWKTE